MPLGIRPLVDFAFKKIFGSPENTSALIGLLNAVLKLQSPIREVTILNPFSYQEFEDAKQIVLDVRARDQSDRWLNIEMQVSIASGLLKRLTYYACSMYVDQLQSGDNYSNLNPAISICLLNKNLFTDSPQPHHRFQMLDRSSGRQLTDAIEVHTVELLKYNLEEASIATASRIEQWVFFLLRAHEFDEKRLRELLPAIEFQQAIATVATISEKTEDRSMYDQREKALRDHEWRLAAAREEGEKIGEARGEARGVVLGRIQILQGILSMTVSSEAALRDAMTEELIEIEADLQRIARARGQA
ncbi:PD-(D/E)XK nuclease family transposase [Rosistilla ulvae]|uniref:PD-(D/E)XK nuclease family transposase n=1 Tax=Rosistilla ulvae TaxID=1930277 RepID=A0A517M6F5_9BACT|nr:Rpn family recombination-promoting nuclease/putative transposase [Rosistilla ulvae]QDS90470.1 PD-(D/E)XK nuclease family transposase [Rosistilla ulvae]